MFKKIFFYSTLETFHFLRFLKFLHLVELIWNKLFHTSSSHCKESFLGYQVTVKQGWINGLCRIRTG